MIIQYPSWIFISIISPFLIIAMCLFFLSIRTWSAKIGLSFAKKRKDMDKLYQIALNRKNGVKIIKGAIQSLRDNTYLYNLALSIHGMYLEDVIKNISDQQLIINAFMNTTDYNHRCYIVQYIHDQSFLEFIITEDQSKRPMTNDIKVTHFDELSKSFAINNIEDEDFLFTIACTRSTLCSDHIKEKAFFRLEDPSKIIEAAGVTSSKKFVDRAIWMLTKYYSEEDSINHFLNEKWDNLFASSDVNASNLLVIAFRMNHDSEILTKMLKSKNNAFADCILDYFFQRMSAINPYGEQEIKRYKKDFISFFNDYSNILYDLIYIDSYQYGDNREGFTLNNNKRAIEEVTKINTTTSTYICLKVINANTENLWYNRKIDYETVKTTYLNYNEIMEIAREEIKKRGYSEYDYFSSSSINWSIDRATLPTHLGG